jgi:hypothetical protein
MSLPGAATVTVASTVIVCPFTEGFADVWTAVAVKARLTVCVTGDEVDAVKLALPPYTAWISSPEKASANAVLHEEVPV